MEGRILRDDFLNEILQIVIKHSPGRFIDPNRLYDIIDTWLLENSKMHSRYLSVDLVGTNLHLFDEKNRDKGIISTLNLENIS